MSATKRCLYVDAFSGVSGDMLIGALLDAGAPLNALETAFNAMGLDVEVSVKHVKRHGISAKKVYFSLKKIWNPPRLWEDFKRLIRGSTLGPTIQSHTLAILERLFKIEAKVHDKVMEECFLHELGSYDTILDIVGTLVLLDSLGIEEVISSPIPCPRGFIKGVSHGVLPIPAPAVARLMTGVPAYGIELDVELVTPTGLAILKHISSSYGPFPEMVVQSVGYGAGEMEIDQQPNLLRIWLGELASERGTNQVTEIITVVDDASGEILAHAQNTLLDQGAMDAYIIPAIMKKGRPGFELHVLAPVGQEARLLEILFKETSTIGARLSKVERVCLKRRSATRSTPWGTVKVKEVEIFGEKRIYPEYEAALKVSKDAVVPLIEIYRAVEQ